MRRLILVRHGPTHAKTMVGWSDLPADLSDMAAVGRLIEFLPREALVVSSDLLRARTTADAIQGHRQRLAHDPALREIHFGRWELKHFKEIETEDPERARAFWENPGEIRPPDGESWNELSRRVDGAVDTLLEGYPDRDLVVVAHFGAILTQLQRALQIGPDQAFAHRLNPLSVTEITISQDGWNAKRINHHP
jgi:broad specificity phosphatase PhoE